MSIQFISLKGRLTAAPVKINEYKRSFYGYKYNLLVRYGPYTHK